MKRTAKVVCRPQPTISERLTIHLTESNGSMTACASKVTPRSGIDKFVLTFLGAGAGRRGLASFRSLPRIAPYTAIDPRHVKT